VIFVAGLITGILMIIFGSILDAIEQGRRDREFFAEYGISRHYWKWTKRQQAVYKAGKPYAGKWRPR
jgi:hypothetical protein